MACVSMIQDIKQFSQNFNTHYQNDMSKHHWDSLENQHKFLDKMASALHITTVQDWLHISYATVLEVAGHFLVHKYNCSISQMIVAVYPELYWDPLDRKCVSHNYWNLQQNQERFINMCQYLFNINSYQDWYRLSQDQFSQVAKRAISRISIITMLQTRYPEQDWDIVSFSKRGKKSRQWWLVTKIREFFPNEDVHEDYWHIDMKRDNNHKTSAQLDIFIPRLNLAFEYHGEQHYYDLRNGYNILEAQCMRDKEKAKLCSTMGIKLIVIPYWWDNQPKSLLATIYKEYPFALDDKMTCNMSKRTAIPYPQ